MSILSGSAVRRVTVRLILATLIGGLAAGGALAAPGHRGGGRGHAPIHRSYHRAPVRRGGYGYGYGAPAPYVYAPPAEVYAPPQPSLGINLMIPLRIR